MSPQILILGESSRQTPSDFITLSAEAIICSTSSSVILTSWECDLSLALINLSITWLRVSGLLFYIKFRLSVRISIE